MSGYQFGHVQTYSAKGNKVNRSFKDILLENSRAPGHCNHVEEPQKPRLLFGQDPQSLIPVIEERVGKAKAALKGTGKRIQSNTHVMEGAVFSYPTEMAKLKTGNDDERKAYTEWLRDMANYAKRDAERRGMTVLSIVQHTDEKYPHIHCISVPNNDRHDAKKHSDGHKAAEAAKAAGESPKTVMKAYRDAMKTWQDNLHRQVSVRYGHTRTGPGRSRLTRREWNTRKETAEREAEQIRKLEQLNEMVRVREQQVMKYDDMHNELADVKFQNQQLNKQLRAAKEAHQSEVLSLRQQNEVIKRNADEAFLELQQQARAEIERLEDELEQYKPHSPGLRR